jgi:hypothetical protein
VFGTNNPVQRCRNHKLENVSGYLPEDLKPQVKPVMRAAFSAPGEGRHGAAGPKGTFVASWVIRICGC